jgi:hypothetical protein
MAHLSLQLSTAPMVPFGRAVARCGVGRIGGFMRYARRRLAATAGLGLSANVAGVRCEPSGPAPRRAPAETAEE